VIFSDDHDVGVGTMRLAALVTAGCLIGVQSAIAAGTIYYGSRTGMVVDVVSMSGLDTAQSVIHTRHTRPNAMAFCRDYVGKVTPKCIEDELATRLNDEVTADCGKGEFIDFGGDRYRFLGPSNDKDSMAEYRIVDLKAGEEADGSMASGYPVNLDIYTALCPEHFFRAESLKR